MELTKTETETLVKELKVKLAKNDNITGVEFIEEDKYILEV
jgi:hypothetical protein